MTKAYEQVTPVVLCFASMTKASMWTSNKPSPGQKLLHCCGLLSSDIRRLPTVIVSINGKPTECPMHRQIHRLPKKDTHTHTMCVCIYKDVCIYLYVYIYIYICVCRSANMHLYSTAPALHPLRRSAAPALSKSQPTSPGDSRGPTPAARWRARAGARPPDAPATATSAAERRAKHRVDTQGDP